MDASSITRIGVVGAGLMGHGIALQFALRGYDVMLNDLDQGILDDALANVKINLGVLRGLGLASEEDEQAVPARIHTARPSKRAWPGSISSSRPCSRTCR